MILNFIKNLWSRISDPVEASPVTEMADDSDEPGMTPCEIKAELIRRGLTLTDIANEAGSSVPEVSRCISGDVLYLKIREVIAKRLERSPRRIFASHHPKPKARSTRWCKAA